MKYLRAYREAIRRGEILAGVDMITELDNLIADADSGEYVIDTTEAYLRIDFIEKCIRLTKAPYYNKPFVLMLWQKAFIEAVYSFKMQGVDGGTVNRFQEVLLLLPRKNGKSELAAALMMSELVFAASGSDIICSGQDDGTADLCYTAVDTMRLLIDPTSADTWRNQKGIRCNINNNHIYKLASSTRQREGRNIDVATIDEVWSLPEDGDIYKSIQQSTSTKADYKIFMIGSEGFIDGFLNKKRQEYTAIIYGEDEDVSSKRKLPWIYSQDSEQEIWLTDEDGICQSWQKSNPAVGVIKSWTYLRDRVDEARKSKSDRIYTLCKDFNFKQSSAVAWLGEQDYKYVAEYDLEEFRGAVVLGGVDLSETTDMTSAKVLMMKPNDRTKYILSHYWIPESKLESSDDKQAGAKYKEWAKDGLLTICEGNDNDLALVADWFYKLRKDYGLKLYKCGYDVKFSKEFLRRMDEYGFDCEIVIQSKQVLSNAVKLCEADFRAHYVNYNGNEIDAWCFGNAALEVDNYGNCQIVKIKGQPGKRIDGAVTLSIVYEMYRRYRSDFVKALKG